MLIKKASGITSKVVYAGRPQRYTTFQLAATEAVMATMADIEFQVPDSDFTPDEMEDYAGGWVPLKYGGNPIVLNSDTRSVTLYGTVTLRVVKAVDEAVGVAWATI